jgi:cytochrome c peroxidase
VRFTAEGVMADPDYDFTRLTPDAPDGYTQGPNYRLRPEDFPFRKLEDSTNRESAIEADTDNVASSQGVHYAVFGQAGYPGADADGFYVGSGARTANVRRVEPRNTPTMINAAFTLQNFWDRRAGNVFNGVSVHGAGDSAAQVLRADGVDRIAPVTVRIGNASLASQAVGPPLSDREMGSLGRTFQDVGKRLASARPLRRQRVARDDSVLARWVDRRRDASGLDTTYRRMIESAFQPAWWRSNRIVRVEPNGTLAFVSRPDRPLQDHEYTMLEYNFSLFFGLAIQLYEMTLVSDDAPIDRFFEGQADALTAKELRGLAIFDGETADTACSGCHSGAELTDNSRRILDGAVVDGVRQPAEWVERMFNGECEVVAYDQGVYNIGVRPTHEDLGHGADDPFGNPLSFIQLLTLPASEIPAQELLAYPIPNVADPAIAIGERTITEGTFKVPSLRNLQLTAPYFHNGGQRTIRQVVEFYDRGGDFREHNVENVDFEIGKLNLTRQQIDDLVAFLGRPLTDARVVRQSAPFDHPQLFVPNGQAMDGDTPRVDREGVARDLVLEIPEVGRRGGRLPSGFLE